jgi:hypothetical protein
MGATTRETVIRTAAKMVATDDLPRTTSPRDAIAELIDSVSSDAHAGRVEERRVLSVPLP